MKYFAASVAMLLAVEAMSKAWHIKDWDYRENAETRKYVDLVWFRTKVKLLGEGLGHTLAQPDRQGPFLYGMFKLIEQVAAGGKLHERGWLFRNGSPMDAARVANLLRVPEEWVQQTLTFFSQPPLDWLEFIEIPFVKNGESPDVPPTTGRQPGESPDVPPTTGRQPGEIQHPTDRPTNDKLPTDVKKEEEAHFPEQPSDSMVFEHVANWPGQPASGTPKIERSFAEQWLADMAGRTRGWPQDWKRKLEADWRVKWRGWGKSKKTGAPKKPREGWQIEKELTAVKEQLRTHRKTAWPANKPLPDKIAKDFDALIAKRTELEQELSAA